MINCYCFRSKVSDDFYIYVQNNSSGRKLKMDDVMETWSTTMRDIPAIAGMILLHPDIILSYAFSFKGDLNEDIVPIVSSTSRTIFEII